MAVDWIWILLCRGEHRSPAKKHKNTFLLSYFCMTKRMVYGGEATSCRLAGIDRFAKSEKKHALQRAVSNKLFHIFYRLGECALVAVADLFFRYRLDFVAGVGGAE